MADETSMEVTEENLPECFVIMPISTPDGYPAGHFDDIYKGLFKPACKKAGFLAIRADDETGAGLIHHGIVTKLVEAPMALCDLSSGNPNVFFELGIRQAFDKPVALVQEKGTPRRFDIEGFRVIDYERVAPNYLGVHAQEDAIATTIASTKTEFDSGKIVNSIVKLLNIKGAQVGQTTDAEQREGLNRLMLGELGALRREIAGVSEAVLGQDSRLHHPPGWGMPDEQSIEGRVRIAADQARSLLESLRAGEEVPQEAINSTSTRLGRAHGKRFEVFTNLHGYPPSSQRDIMKLYSELRKYSDKANE